MDPNWAIMMLLIFFPSVIITPICLRRFWCDGLWKCSNIDKILNQGRSLAVDKKRFGNSKNEGTRATVVVHRELQGQEIRILLVFCKCVFSSLVFRSQ